MDQHLPAFLVKPQMAGIRLFNWLALVLVARWGTPDGIPRDLVPPRTAERAELPRAARCCLERLFAVRFIIPRSPSDG